MFSRGDSIAKVAKETRVSLLELLHVPPLHRVASRSFTAVRPSTTSMFKVHAEETTVVLQCSRGSPATALQVGVAMALEPVLLIVNHYFLRQSLPRKTRHAQLRDVQGVPSRELIVGGHPTTLMLLGHSQKASLSTAVAGLQQLLQRSTNRHGPTPASSHSTKHKRAIERVRRL